MNKRVFVLAAAVLLTLSAMACAQEAAKPPAAPATQAANPPASVTPTGASKVATVHIQQAIGECAEGKKATEDLQKRFAPKRDELERKQKEIQDLQEKLRQGEKVLSDEQKNQLMREIDRKTKDFNRDNDDATADYQQAGDAMINAIGNKMLQVVAAYAQQNGFDLILNSAQPGEVLWQTQRVDITQQIVGAYNLTFPVTAGGMSAPPAAPATRPQTMPSKPATPPSTPPAKKP
jgi:outer membrane protein